MDNDLDDCLDFIDEVEDQLLNEHVDRLIKRYIRNVPNPFEFYSEVEFKSRYPFSKNTVRGIILPLIPEGYTIENNRGLPIRPEYQLFAALAFFGTGEFQLVAGDIGHSSQGCMSLIIKKIAWKLAKNLG